MPFEMFHVRGSDKIIKDKNLENYVHSTLEYIADALHGSLYRGELLRQALKDSGWRENGPLNVLEGRRYQYLGLRKGIAISGGLNSYEIIIESLAKLQIGYDKKMIQTGIVILNAARSEKSPYGSSRELAEAEVEMLYPTISLPCSIVLFDLGEPTLPDEKGGE